MFINKIGYEHSEYGTNCQDFGIETDRIKYIVDGCSEGKHSEVGSKLFCHLLSKEFSVKHSFDMMTIIFNEYESIKNHLLFTILNLEETEAEFIVNSCGDGVIIKQLHDDTFEYIEIDQQGAPKYYAYNYIPAKYLSKYSEGVDFEPYFFNKDNFKHVGIASDGLSYILNSPYKGEFETLLLKRNTNGIKRLINREHKLFKDDITILI